MKHKPLAFTNMTQVRYFKWGWVHFRAFKVRFESLANRALEDLKRDYEK